MLRQDTRQGQDRKKRLRPQQYSRDLQDTGSRQWQGRGQKKPASIRGSDIVTRTVVRKYYAETE